MRRLRSCWQRSGKNEMAMKADSRNRRLSPGLVGLVGVVLLLVFLKLTTLIIVRRAETRYPAEGEFVSVDGIRLHYVSEGEGQPVLLLHGDGGSTKDWTMSIFDRIAEEYQVVAFDRPGLGYSERPEHGGDPFVQAEIMHSAVEELGLQQPVLVGHSRGGSIVLAYALAYPEEIAGAVTLAAAPYGGEVSSYSKTLAAPLVGPLLAHTAFVPLGKPAVRAGLETAFSPERAAPEAYVEAYAAYELRPKQLLAHARDQVQGRKAVQDLKMRYDEIRVPLVIVHGTADRNVPVQQARRLHGEVPGSIFLELPGAGHELMFTRPDAVMAGIQKALADSQTPD